MIIRAACREDIEALFTFGNSAEAFSVSDSITFYEKTELAEFIDDPNWVTGVAIIDNELIGFISAHRMSSHWAMLDNFYIAPLNRGSGLAKQMFEWLQQQIKQWQTSYLSCLVDIEDTATIKLLSHKSWTPRKIYQWFDLEL